MNNNTIQITLAALAVSSIALFAIATLPVAVSYTAVAILVAVAAVDYRRGRKSYSAR